MKRFMSRACLIGCVLYYSPTNGFFILNSSDTPKNIEVIAYLPLENSKYPTPQTVLKKELLPEGMIEVPYALREVSLDVHWGKELIVPSEKTNWKPIITETNIAAQWPIIGTMLCGKAGCPCHVVMPPTWHLEEDTTGITVTTDEGKKIHASSRAELAKEIPYRRMADTCTQERVLMTSANSSQRIYDNWKKVGKNYRTGEEIVIPVSWSIRTEGNENIITTDTGKELRIPLKHATKIDPLTGKEHIYTIVNEDVIKKIVPYRRKDGIIKELFPIERLFVIEESAQKPIKTTQYNLFRRFAAQEAEPSAFERGVPSILSQDHVFEISGSEYQTDISLLYIPDKEPATKRTKLNDCVDEENYKKQEGKHNKKHRILRKSTVKKSTLAPEIDHKANAAT